jgi:hypothetical protein
MLYHWRWRSSPSGRAPNEGKGMADAFEGGVEHNLRGERIRDWNFFYFYCS